MATGDVLLLGVSYLAAYFGVYRMNGLVGSILFIVIGVLSLLIQDIEYGFSLILIIMGFISFVWEAFR